MAQTNNQQRSTHIGGYILHPDKTPLYISLLTQNTQNENFSPIQITIIVKLKTLQIQIEKYTYRPQNQTVTNCHTFKERSKKIKRSN